MTVRYSDKNPVLIVFQLRGSVWLEVLPYCIVNCILTVLVVLAKKNGITIAFSPKGHASLGLLVSFLVINKVYLALDRYMSIRSVLGQAFLSLRETHQLAIVFTENDESAKAWRSQVRDLIMELCDCTIRVLKDEEKSAFLSRNECPQSAGDDPMAYAKTLRSHVYNNPNVVSLELLEKMTILNMLNEYLKAYRELLKIASTPLPFPMIQMGRTFLFLWIFSMPLALVGLELELTAELIFILFITYGYIGLELVAMRLLRPWGDTVNDLNISGARDAAIVGMQNDCLPNEKGERRNKNVPHHASAGEVYSSEDSYGVLKNDMKSTELMHTKNQDYYHHA